MASTGAVGAVRVRPEWSPPERNAAQERFHQQLMQIDQLPSAPEIAQRMLASVNRDDANAKDLAALIAKDPSVTAKLLRLANSAAFALRTEVTSVQQAVTMMGFGRVRDVVLGLSVWGALDKGTSAAAVRHRKALWAHSAAVAATGKMLAERSGNDPGAAFTVGLLHDVGKMVLGLRLGDSYWEMVDDAVAHGETITTMETNAFGCHHGLVGAWLLELWKLPPSIVEAVSVYHEPLVHAFGLDLPAILTISDRLVNATDVTPVIEEAGPLAPHLFTLEQWAELQGFMGKEQGALESVFQ